MTSEHVLVSAATILVVGLGAQWLAWRLHVPSIVLLLLGGFIAGPVTGVLEPDRLLGPLLVPVVAISVAVILFEGSLKLRTSEFREVGGVVVRLVVVGTVVTAVVTAAAAERLLGLDAELAILLGSILVVTGPTVIIPLLQHVRPSGTVGSVLRWEGILIDPVGAMLAVLVFEGIVAGGLSHAAPDVAVGVARTLASGVAVGAAAGATLVVLLRRYWIPDFLRNSVTLMLLVAGYVAADTIQSESGLLAAVVMGLVVGNSRGVDVDEIAAFKESLSVLLISGVFVLLAARVRFATMERPDVATLLFVVVLIAGVRPAVVALSTWRTRMPWRERAFLAAMAPRGIVAAAVSSVFALRLGEIGFDGAERLASIVFLVVVVTVVVYGFAAAPVARALGVAQPGRGTLILGAYAWVRELARKLEDLGHRVILVDANRSNVTAARLAGLHAVQARTLSEETLDGLSITGVGRVLAMTGNDDLNALAAIRLSRIVPASEIYRLAPQHPDADARGRVLFSPDATLPTIVSRFLSGGRVRATRITDRFDIDDFRARYDDSALPLFVVDGSGELIVLTAGMQAQPRRGEVLVSIVQPRREDA